MYHVSKKLRRNMWSLEHNLVSYEYSVYQNKIPQGTKCLN